MRGGTLAVLLLSLAGGEAGGDEAPAMVAPARPASLRECDLAVQAHPREHAAYGCYLRLAHAWSRGRAPVLEHLEERLRAMPDDPFLQLWGGILAHDASQATRAEHLLRPAADRFRALDSAHGEVLARTELSVLLCYQSRGEDAQRELERLSAVAERSGDPELRASALQAAGLCARKAHDHGKAIALSTEALQLLAAAPRSFWTDRLKTQTLDGLGSAYSDSGRHREAYEVFLTQSELVADDPFALAIVRHRLASQALDLGDEGELGWDEVDARIHQSLAMEAALRGLHWPPYATRIVAAARLGASPEAMRLLDEALVYWRPRSPWGVLTALQLRASFRSELDPGSPGPARVDVDEAMQMARSSANRLSLGTSLLIRSHVDWQSGDGAGARREALAALDELDRHRDLQLDPQVRAWTGSEASFAYRLVAGWMLDPAHGGGSGGDVEQAFAAIERHRGRALLEALASARVDLRAPAGPLRDREVALLTELGTIQRRLLDRGLSPQARAVALGELTRVERSYEVLRDEVVRQQPRIATLDLAVPSVREVQEALEPDQAFLSFHTWRMQHTLDAQFRDGSSWVLAITRDTVGASRIPDADVLADRIRFLLSVIERRDGSEGPGAAALHRDLLAEALRALPPGVTRLIIAPDGPLHRVPFGALPERAGGLPLGSAYRVSVVPSAALWLRWRAQRLGRAEESGERVALVLANASTGSPPETPPAFPQRDATWLRELRLPDLPFTAHEAAEITRTLGGRSRVMAGAAASERFLKSADLGDVRILHLAAHAVVDESRPERSAVVLQPGSPDEDGLLQLREIAGLDLSGKLVVLAACRSSGGRVLGAEGPINLARGFFQAGAPSVVGSLWQLRDDESAAFMRDLYRGLGRGLSVASAMAGAQAEAIRRGAPAAAWAGMVVLGDGDLLPFPPERGPRTWPLAALAVGAATAAILALRALRVRGRSQAVRPAPAEPPG